MFINFNLIEKISVYLFWLILCQVFTFNLEKIPQKYFFKKLKNQTNFKQILKNCQKSIQRNKSNKQNLVNSKNSRKLNFSKWK